MTIEQYKILSDRAARLLEVINEQSRRAFILELAGTPKAGKTTSVSTIKSFFKECGYRVEVLKERASECPLLMKGHFSFNTWTTCSLISEILSMLEKPLDLIILDRGYFDALVWLELQHRASQISPEEKVRFSDFVLLDRWRSLLDAVVIMSARPDLAITRENENLIVPRKGSLMNISFLSRFNDALNDVKLDYGDKFRNIIEFSSVPGVGIVESNANLIEKILPYMEEWADPKIAVVPRAALDSIMAGRNFISGDSAFTVWDTLQSVLQIRQRSMAENDHTLVQIVACGVHMNHHDNGLFVFKRSDLDEKTERYGSLTVWKGCHINAIDPSSVNMQKLRSSLSQRIQDDVHLDIMPKAKQLSICWSPDSESKHIGIVFYIDISDHETVESMREKEFRRSGRGSKTIGKFLQAEELRSLGSSLEPWSKLIAESIVTR